VTRTRTTPATLPQDGPTTDGGLILALFDTFCPGPTWQVWRVLLKGLVGESLTEDEAALFAVGTNRPPPTAPASELWVIAGRRSGKSRISALLVVFLAAIRKWDNLAPGEKPMVSLISPSRRQSSIIQGYAKAMIAALPGVEILRSTAEEVELSTGVTISIETANYRTSRGFTLVSVICDEIAFWTSDEQAANPDVEILRAVRPSLASVPGSLLVAISSPYATRGVLHDTHARHYGRTDTDTLVWQSDTRTLNPKFSQRAIDKAMEEDPASAQSEFGGVFRSDLEILFSLDALNAVTVSERYELQPQSGVGFVGFVDPSGGSKDSFTLAIAHRDARGRAVLDMVRERKPPFSPEQVCAEFAADIRRYGCKLVYSDAYAGEWPREQFAKHHVTVEQSPLTRSELYLELLPSVNSASVELLDLPRLKNQLKALERRTGRSGRDAVDHPRGQRDDLANAAAGALVCATRGVGLKAFLPSDFTVCVNDAAASRCPFFLTSQWWPRDAHCRQWCAGLRSVLPAYQQHREQAGQAGEPVLSAVQFLEQRFDVGSSPITSRVWWARVSYEYEQEFV
jgi:hypothetical protein